MATDLNAGPWDTAEAARTLGGSVIKEAAARDGGSVHGWVTVQRSDGRWGVRGLYTTKMRRPGRSPRVESHYVKAGIDASCGHPKRYTPERTSV
jgi:hypothetical protein